MKQLFGALVNPILYLIAILGLAGFSSIRDLYNTLFSNQNLVENLLPKLSFLLDDWRLLFFFMFLILLYRTWINMKFRTSPISVLSTKITLRFLKPDGSKVHVFRNQVLRANHPNVTAYYATMTPRWGGRISTKSINCELFGDNSKVISTFDQIGEETTGWEIVQKFNPSIPYTPFFPFIPNFLYYSDNFNLLDRLVVKKSSECNYIDDLNTDSPEFNLKAMRYTHQKVEIKLLFMKGGVPVPGSIQAQLIQRNGVRDLTPEKTEQPTEFIVKVSDLRQDRLRVTWKWQNPGNEAKGVAQEPQQPPALP